MATITINSLPTASTIDATNDLLPIYTNSLTATQAISRNTYLNLSSQPVGLTDSQTLTNKTLTSPTINNATLSGTLSGTYTIGGTPTFPSSVTQNTVVQTLTNKTLTSPTINSPTITNATISADTLTGYTVSNTGTIYGIPVTTGTISGTYLTASTVGTTQLASASVTNTQIASAGLYTTKIYNPYKFYVYRNAAFTANGLIQHDTKTSPGFDTGNNVDVVTNKGRFTAPIAGFYYFSAMVIYTISGGNVFFTQLYKNGVNTAEGVRVVQGTTAGFTAGSSVSVLLQLAVGDYIEIYGTGGGAGATGPGASYFQGFLVSAT